jgi:hypothetical protein
MHNKQVLIEAIKNLGKAKAPARKKDVVINQRQSPYMQQPSLPTAKEGGENEEKEFVNSQEHGVDTPIYVDLRVGKSKIHGEGVFSNQPVKEGTVVGVSHIRKQFERDGEMYQAPFPSKILGLYNHTEENPNVTEIDNGDYISLIAIRDIQPGEELVSNYYNNNIQDLEKPEDFKNELVRADLGLITKLSKLSKPASTASKYPNIVNTEIGLISKNAPFIGTGNQVIKKGRNISIPETNELLQNIALDLPATALEFPPVYYHGTHQSGELITGTLGVNQKGLSTAFASNLDDAVGYSMRDLDSSPISDFKKWWGETRLHYPSESPYFPKPEFYDNLYNTRLEEYNKLTELEKSFIDDKFPMLFGIHPRYGDNSRFWPVSSDIGSETAIGGKVGFDEITNLFVPQSKIGLTQDYLQGRNPFKISPIEPFINRLGFRHSDQQKRFYDKNYSDEIVKSGFGSLLTRPLTLFGKNELTPGDHLYRKIGNSAGLKDLIDKGGAQAPRPFKMKSGMTIDTPFFGVGKTPNENYRGMFAVETALPSKSKYNWSSYAGGTENWGVAPYNEEGYLMKNIPLEDLNVYRKKWFSNNYKKLDPLNLEEGLKYAKTQNLLENLWKWGVLGGLGYSGYQYSKEGEKDEKNLGGSINDRVLRDLDRDLKDPRRSKRFSKSLLATNQLFAPNYLFNKPSPRRIYNPNAQYFENGGVTTVPPHTKEDYLNIERDVKKFADKYVTSAHHRNLLEKYNYPEDKIQWRMQDVLNYNPDIDTRFSLNGPSFVGAAGETFPLKEGQQEGQPIVQYNLNNIHPFPIEHVIAHEWGHIPISSGFNPLTEEERNEFINRLKPGAVRNEHDAEPQENRSDQFELRYFLDKEGIYDSSKGEEFTQKHLDDYRKKTRNNHRIFSLYSDEDIIWLMNNIASVNDSKELNMAQKGGYIQAELSEEEIQKYVDGGYIVEDLPKANLGYISKLIQPAKNTVTGLSNTIKGMTNITPTLANLSKTNLLKSAYPQQMELISNLKNANIISPTLNESVLAGYPNLLNLATKRGIQDALTFSRSTTPSVLEGLSSSGTRTPISNLDMGNFIKYGLVGDDPGLAMYTASHVPGMRYGRRDGLSRLPYKTTYVGNVEQGTPESLDALYTHPQITGIPQNIKEGIFGDTYGSYASILRYPFDYSGSAFDMFDRYKTFENTVFDKGRTLRKYMGAKDAAAGDIGALNFVNKPTSDNIFYQSLFSHASEVPFIGYPGQKVLEPVATYTKPIVQEIKADRENINKLYSEGKYEEVINALNEKVKSGNFGSVESNIKSYEIDPKFPKFDISQYNVPTEGVPTPYTLNAFDPKTGLIPVKGDLESIANTARQAYNSFIEHAVLMDAFRDPTNVVRYPYSPLKYKYKKGGQLPKAELGLITKAPQLPKLLGLKHSANILDDLLVRTSNLWQTPQGISRLNEMIVNTPALSSLNVTPEIMVNDLSNLTNLNYIADDAYEQQKILNEQKLDLRKILREANNAGTSKSDIRSAQRKNLSNLLETENKIKDLEFYYEGMGTQYIEPRYSWQTVQSNPWNHSITIGKDKFTDADIPMVGMHEITHFPGAYYGKLSPGSATYHTYLDDMLSGLDLKSDSELIKQTVNYGTPLKYNMGNLMTGSERIKLKDKFGNVIPGEFEHPLLSAKNYFKNSLDEMSPFLAEVRENMLQDGFIKHPYETMTPTKLKTYYNNYNNIKGNKYPLRYFEIMKPTESNFKLSSDVFNKMLIGLPAVGAAALGSDLDEKAVGGPMLGDPPVVEDPLPITPDSELDDAQKYIRNWFRNRVLPETDDKFYNRIMSKSLDKAKERVNTFPDYTPLVTDDPTARGTYIGGEIPEIQVVPGLSPEEDLTTKVHELTTYVNEPLSDNLQYQDIYGNIIKQNVKSFKEGWGGLTGADKKAAKEFYNYVTDPSEDNIHSYMMNARRIFDVSPDQVVTEADIENWKKTAEDAGMLDKNSENYNDELYILFKLAKDNKSMTNMFNYLAMDESPQMEGDLQRAEQGLVVKALSTLGKVAPEISAASNLVKTAPLINAAVPLVNTTVKFAPEITTADWANWNKATPNYSKLMQEYADIEESTKGMGTWMKNPDGTPYLGSPLQFIQEQSENFKNAFPEGYYKVYRGVQPENSFQDFSYSNKKELMGDRAIFTANRMLANKYARFFKDEQLKSFLDPSDPDNTRGTFSLVYPIGKHMAVDMRDRVWNHLGYMEHGVSNSLPDLESFNNYITNIKDAYGLSKEYRNTDDIAKFLPTSNLNSIILKGLNDSGKGNVHIVNNRPGNYLKSTIGNEGFFNMNSPNIYKSLGGESDYELGDEVDKTTMERLIKEGYTFEEI